MFTKKLQEDNGWYELKNVADFLEEEKEMKPIYYVSSGLSKEFKPVHELLKSLYQLCQHPAWSHFSYHAKNNKPDGIDQLELHLYYALKGKVTDAQLLNALINIKKLSVKKFNQFSFFRDDNTKYIYNLLKDLNLRPETITLSNQIPLLQIKVNMISQKFDQVMENLSIDEQTKNVDFN